LITISRLLARQLRAMFRRAGIGKAYGGFGQRALFLASAESLRIRGLSHSEFIDAIKPQTAGAGGRQ
jgi:hypothetical protein